MFHDPHGKIHILILEYYIYLLFVVSLIFVVLYILEELFVLIFSFMFEDVLAGKEGWYLTHAIKYCVDENSLVI